MWLAKKLHSLLSWSMKRQQRVFFAIGWPDLNKYKLPSGGVCKSGTNFFSCLKCFTHKCSKSYNLFSNFLISRTPWSLWFWPHFHATTTLSIHNMFFRKKKGSKETSDNESSGSRDLVFIEPQYVKRPRRFKFDVDFAKMIALPPLVDENEWLATHSKYWLNY